VNDQFDGYAFHPASKYTLWMTSCILSVQKQADLETLYPHDWSVWNRKEVLPIDPKSVLVLFSPLYRTQLRQSFMNAYETTLMPSHIMIVSYTEDNDSFCSQRKTRIKITKYFRHPYPRRRRDLIQEYKLAFNMESFKTFVENLRETFVVITQLHPQVVSESFKDSTDTTFPYGNPSRLVGSISPVTLEDSVLTRQLIDVYLLSSVAQHINASVQICSRSVDCRPISKELAYWPLTLRVSEDAEAIHYDGKSDSFL